MRGEEGLSPQALEFWTPRPCLHQLSDTGSRPLRPGGPQPTQAHTLAGSHGRKTEGGLISQGPRRASLIKTKVTHQLRGQRPGETPRLTPVTTGSAQLTPLKPSAQNQAVAGVVGAFFLTKQELSRDSLSQLLLSPQPSRRPSRLNAPRLPTPTASWSLGGAMAAAVVSTRSGSGLRTPPPATVSQVPHPRHSGAGAYALGRSLYSASRRSLVVPTAPGGQPRFFLHLPYWAPARAVWAVSLNFAHSLLQLLPGFIRKCQTLPKWLYWFSFPIATNQSSASSYPHQQ